MTLSTTSNKDVYTANGTQTVFSYTFRIDSSTDMKVYVDNVLVTTGYSVSGVGDAAGGDVTFTTAPSNTLPIALVREVDLNQLVDYSPYGAFPAEVTEQEFDKLTMMCQQVSEVSGRSLSAPISGSTFDYSLPTPVANRCYKVNSAGTAIEMSGYDPDDQVNNAQLKAWESEAEAMTSEEYATATGLVKEYASDGDGTFTGTTTTSRSSKYWATRWVSIEDYGAVGDDSTDNSTAIQDAIDALSAQGGGQVFVPAGTFRFSTTIDMALNVSIVGQGKASVLKAMDCDGLSLGTLTSGFNMIQFKNFYLLGDTGTTRTGIIQTQASDSGNELYGIRVSNMMITDFNIGMSFGVARNVWIIDNWIQDVNKGIIFEGKSLVLKIRGNQIVYGSGNGTGTSTGISFDWHTYAVGGAIRPEGIKLIDNQVFGFDNAVDVSACVWIYMAGMDINALINGIILDETSAVVTVVGSYIALTGTSAAYGIYCKEQGSSLENQTVIQSNSIIASGTTSSTGIKVATSATGFRDNISILDNHFTGFTTYDIAIHNCYEIEIYRNKCYSTGTTKSIYIEGSSTTRFVKYQDNDLTNGITGGVNTEYTEGTWTPADNSGAGLTFTSVTGTWTKIGNLVTAQCSFTFPTTSDTSDISISGLPFTCSSNDSARQGFVSSMTGSAYHLPLVDISATTFSIRTNSLTKVKNSDASGVRYWLTLIYKV